MNINQYKTKDVVKFHLNMWKEHNEKYMVLVFFMYMFLAGTAPLLAIVFPKYIIDAIIANNLENTLYLIGGFGLLSLILNVLQTRVMYFAEGRFLASRIRSNRIYTTKFSKVTYKYLEDSNFHKRRNEAQSAMGSNNGGYQGTLSIVFYQMAEVFSIICLFVILGTFNYWIIVVAITCTVIQFLLARRVSSFSLGKNQELQERDRQAQYFYRTSNDFAYGKDIRVNNLEEPFTKLFSIKQNFVQSLFKEIKLFEYKLTLVDVLFLVITNGLTYYLVVNAYFDGFLSLGEITMTILGVLTVTIKLQATFKEVARLKQETGKTKVYMSLLDSDIYDSKDEGTHPSFNDIEIEFKNVSFHYPGSNTFVLKNLTFKVDKYQKTALVGINGSGKTTIIKLLCGLYSPTSGTILLNGIDITTINKDYLRQQMSVVFQDVNIYAASVLENITGENPTLMERSRAISALEEVGMYEKVMSLEQGENHQLLRIIDDNGTDLSGGETQKIAIARAIYKENTKLIILDEPTAALDAIAEKAIYEKFNDITSKKTALMISHRLASTKFCDNIIFLEKGRIIEEGTHNDLVNLDNGKYKEMFIAQGKYYKEEVNTNEL